MKTKAKKLSWSHSQLSKNVFAVSQPFRSHRDWEAWALLTSDQHWDNPHSDRDMQRKHLEEAVEKGACVISAGDYFCLMQGKYDKRASKKSIRPEHNVDNYFDAVIRDAADFLEPYAKHYVLIATGNHEQGVENKHEFNVIDRFVGALNDRTGSSIHNGGYSGYLIFKFQREKSEQRSSVVLRYEHGAGGGAPVTGGMIDSFRRAVYFPDADIILSGHTHDSWVRDFQRQRIDKGFGRIRQDTQTHIKCPSYKDEFGEGFGGWATATKGLPPKPKGAWWLRFYWDFDRVCFEVIRAN